MSTRENLEAVAALEAKVLRYAMSFVLVQLFSAAILFPEFHGLLIVMFLFPYRADRVLKVIRWDIHSTTILCLNTCSANEQNMLSIA